MGAIKNVMLDGQYQLDEAYNKIQKAREEGFGFSEAFSYYQGCRDMFEIFTSSFEVEIVDGHHELKGV